MPADLYAPGKAPSPHLSPFTNNEEGYTPDFAETIKQLQEAATAARQSAGGLLRPDAFVGEEEASGVLEAAAKVESAEAQERAYQADLAVKELRAIEKQKAQASGQEGQESEQSEDEDEKSESGSSEEESEGEESEEEGKAPEKVGGKRKTSAAAAKLREAEEKLREEEKMMASALVTRKNKKLYERMKRALARQGGEGWGAGAEEGGSE